MGDRFDEMKGNVKEGVGKVTGNDRMEAEGATEADTAHARREVKGAANEGVGHVKEGLGSALGDEQMRSEGMADRLKGESQRAG